jgi:Flp pilus assembly protein TadG
MKRLRSCLAKLSADRSGNLLLEFSLALPVLAAMVVMMVDAGRYSLQKSAMLQGAREGAQYGSYAPNSASEINATAQNATGLTGVTATSRVYCECTYGVALTDCSVSCTGGAVKKKYVEVTTTKDFSSAISGATKNFGKLGSWTVPSSTTATVTMICP